MRKAEPTGMTPEKGLIRESIEAYGDEVIKCFTD